MSSFSKILDEAVSEFSRLPGIGKRTALRLVLHLLKSPEQDVRRFGQAVIRLKEQIQYCRVCGNISDLEVCSICSNTNRDKSILCVVEDIRDIIAIENTHQFRGVYHVLGGIISPLDGIGPQDINVQGLIDRAAGGSVREIILALSATLEGDTTAFYLYKKLYQPGSAPIRFSSIARGVSVGDELEYADEVTLGRSILNRVPYEHSPPGK